MLQAAFDAILHRNIIYFIYVYIQRKKKNSKKASSGKEMLEKQQEIIKSRRRKTHLSTVKLWTQEFLRLTYVSPEDKPDHKTI